MAQMSDFRHLFHGTVAILFGNVFSLIFAFINILLMANLLGPVRYGYIPTILAISGILIILVDFGVSTTTAKYISEKRYAQNKIISSAFFIKIVLTIICTGVYIITLSYLKRYIDMNQYEWELYYHTVPLIIAAESMYHFDLGVFQGLKRMRWISLMNISWRFLQLLFCISFILMGLGVYGALYGYGCAALLSFLLGLFLFPKKWFTKPEKHSIKTLLNFSLYAFISLSMLTVIVWTDTLCIAYFRSYEEVAYYTIAMRFAMLITTIPLAIEAILYPTVSERYGGGLIDALRSLFVVSTRYILYSAAVSGMLLGIAMPVFVIYFMPDYTLSIYPFFVLLISYLIGSFSIAYISLINGINKPAVIAKILVLQAVLNLILNILFVPVFGFIAAAFSSLISFILATWLAWNAIYRLIGVKINFETFKIDKTELKDLFIHIKGCDFPK